MALTEKQNERLGRLLLAGVPLPIALPIAMDDNPVESATIAVEGVTQLFSEGRDTISNTIQKAAKRKRSKSARAADKKLSAAFKEANRRYRKKDGSLRAGRTQSDIARLAHKLRKKNGTKKGQVRKTARRAFEK